MKLRIEASPEEFESKGPDLIKALADHIQDYDPALADALFKAVKKPPKKEHELKHKVLKDLDAATHKVYQAAMAKMTKQILDLASGELITKALPQDYTLKMNEKDRFHYELARESLKGLGYTQEDFEEGGKLYGLSANELITISREERNAD